MCIMQSQSTDLYRNNISPEIGLIICEIVKLASPYCFKCHCFYKSPFTVQRRGREVKVVGLLIFFTWETHWLSVGINSIPTTF